MTTDVDPDHDAATVTLAGGGSGMLGTSARLDPLRHALPALHAPETVPNSRTWAVIVAYKRDAELERLLVRLAKQSQKLAGAIVVDNANKPSTAETAARFGAEYIWSATNLGGAGGSRSAC